MAVLRFRVRHYLAATGERTGEHLRRVEHAGELGDPQVAVGRVPESQKTPVRITLDSRAPDTGDPSSKRLECDVYLSLQDAERLARLLLDVVGQVP